MDGVYHVASFRASRKHHDSAQQLRQENAEELSEDVAQRKQIQEANRVYPFFVLEVFANFDFQRFDVGEQIGVGDHDALGLGGGAGGEDDLKSVGAGDVGGMVGRGGVVAEGVAEIFQ